MNKIVLLFSVFMMFTVNAQVTNEMKFETIYEKKIDNVTVKLLANNVTYGSIKLNDKNDFQEKDGAIGYVDWETVVTNKSGKEITLDKFHLEKKGVQWRMGELNGESPFPFYNIVETFIKNDQLFIIMFKGGTVILDKYIFTKNDLFEKDSKVITRFLATPSLGNPSGSAIIKAVENSIYFHLSIGTSMGTKNEAVYKLDANVNNLKKLVFDENVKKIKDEIGLFKFLDLDKNVEKVSLEIKTLLINNKYLDKINNFKYLGNIDLSYFKGTGKRTSNLTHFLYQENNLLTKIITYDNYENEWIIGNYIEEEIKQK